MSSSKLYLRGVAASLLLLLHCRERADFSFSPDLDAAATRSRRPAPRGATLYRSHTGTVTGGVAYTNNGGAIKCQHISGGDGYLTAADGNPDLPVRLRAVERSGQDPERSARNGLSRTSSTRRTAAVPAANYTNGQPIPYTGSNNPLNPAGPAIACNPNGAVGYVPPAASSPGDGHHGAVSVERGDLRHRRGLPGVRGRHRGRRRRIHGPLRFDVSGPDWHRPARNGDCGRGHRDRVRDRDLG